MAGRSISMAGFPLMHLDRHLKTLVQELGRFVAMAEEFRKKDWDRTKNMFDRRVVRIISPGTLIDEKFLREEEYNFLLTISMNDCKNEGPIGLAWMDLSTGDFFTQASDETSLVDDVARIGPSEIVLPDSLQMSTSHPLLDANYEQQYLFTFADESSFSETFQQPWQSAVDAPTEDYTLQELKASAALLAYVDRNLFGLRPSVQPPTRRTAEDTLRMDSHTLRALEIRKSIREQGIRGTLLSAIKRTVTKSGARLLSDYLCTPITSVKMINQRLDLVTFFLKRPHIRAYIRILLRASSDAQRTLQKFSLNRGEPEDLLGVKQTIEVMKQIKESLTAEVEKDLTQELEAISMLLERLQPPMEICQVIEEAIDEEALRVQMMKDRTMMEELEAQKAALNQDKTVPTQPPRRVLKREIDLDAAADNWIIKPAFTKALQKLHKHLASSRKARTALEERLREQFKSPGLTLRSLPSYGFVVHVKLSSSGDVLIKDSNETTEVHRTKTTRYYLHREWTGLGTDIERTKAAIRSEELKTFEVIKMRVLEDMVLIRRNSRILDELDVSISFAEIAEEQNFSRPILDYGTSHVIRGGRHAIVEHGLRSRGRQFISNDCKVGDDERIWLITGPNMGGKSTFLRQNALITVLAQTGSYVPADYAAIGVVDQVFSRVGAADNLFAGQSTFMVEMMETGEILNRATRRSFVIMDEVGRGTTHEDGLAIAASTLRHLHDVNKCRTLFATHMHELALLIEAEDSMLGKQLDSAGTYCTDVTNVDGKIVYLHKITEGVNVKSHGLHVAELAGVPQSVVDNARAILERRQIANSR